MNGSSRLILAAAFAIGQVFTAGAQSVIVSSQGKWTITTTQLPGGSHAHSINELGEVVGEGLSPEGTTVRPVWSNGAYLGTYPGIAGTVFSWNSQRHAVGRHVVNSKIACNVWWTPAASGQLAECTGGAYDINESGEAAGSARFTTPTIHRRVVTWKAGVVHRELGLPPGAREAEGTGINDRGDVVGHLTDAVTGRIEAFVHRGGQFTRLQSLPGQFATYAWDINNNGDIAGTSNGGYPVVWKAGALAPTALPVPVGRYPRAVWRINDQGDVVGSTTGIYPVFNSAVLWRNGEFIDLGVLPTGSEAYAYDINNAGVIVGTSTTGSPYGWHAVTWTVTTGTGSSADLGLTLTGSPAGATVGQSVAYTTTVTNRGPQMASSVVATGTLPKCTVGTLAAGSSATCVASVTASSPGTLTQTMTVSASSADPVPSNNTASVSTTVTAAGGADLSLAMTDAPDPVKRGATLVYTLVVRNAGPAASDGVAVTDALPSSVSLLGATSTKGTCSGSSVVNCAIGSLQPGETATVLISTRAATAGTTLNAAKVTATTTDPATSNNTASTMTRIRR